MFFKGRTRSFGIKYPSNDFNSIWCFASFDRISLRCNGGGVATKRFWSPPEMQILEKLLALSFFTYICCCCLMISPRNAIYQLVILVSLRDPVPGWERNWKRLTPPRFGTKLKICIFLEAKLFSHLLLASLDAACGRQWYGFETGVTALAGVWWCFLPKPTIFLYSDISFISVKFCNSGLWRWSGFLTGVAGVWWRADRSQGGEARCSLRSCSCIVHKYFSPILSYFQRVRRQAVYLWEAMMLIWIGVAGVWWCADDGSQGGEAGCSLRSCNPAFLRTLVALSESRSSLVNLLETIICQFGFRFLCVWL